MIPAARAVVIMGVSGAGKTTVGRLLAARLAWAFYDGDDFHPPANVTKMRLGTPLTDADRRPWLARLNELARNETAAGRNVVIGCSALRATYRAWLSDGVPAMRFVHLAGGRDLIAARLATRSGHFMPATLLDSQFATLEAPDDAIVVPVDRSPDAIVQSVVAALDRP